jgi:uncharacterized membrane protein YkvA (DUF1232 family)
MKQEGRSVIPLATGRSWKERAKGLRQDVYALYLAYQDPRVPRKAKVLMAAAVAYFASPIDLIPDFIPVLGYLDDAVIVPFIVAAAIKLVPKEVMDECRERAKTELKVGRAKWVAAGLVVLVWAFVLLLVLRLIWPGLFVFSISSHG